jgi:hypothetical protein
MSNPTIVIENIKEEDLVSRETASIELKKLKDEKIIATKNKTPTILDLERLKKLSTIYYEDQLLPYSF